MAIRNQPYSEKHPFASPTTPGLYVTFRNYVIELVCLNVNSSIGPRFWSDKKYWGPKYGREVRGVANLSKELDLTDGLTQTALVQIIKEYNIGALVAKKTVARVVKLTRKKIEFLRSQREALSKNNTSVEIDQKKNAIFVETGKKSRIAKIRETENG
jgi:hypothetical protein